MATHRIDLGPNRWMAANVEVFLHVRVRRGQLLRIVVAPVREALVDHFGFLDRSSIFNNPGAAVSTAFAFLVVLPQIVWNVLHDKYQGLWGALALAAIVTAYLFWILLLLRHLTRLRKPVANVGRERIFFSWAETGRPEFIDFASYLASLSSGADTRCRKVHKYALNAWWVMLPIGAIPIAVSAIVIPWMWDKANPLFVFAASTFLVLLIFSVAWRHRLIHADLRTAHAQLLDYESDAAIKTLQRFLQGTPNHPYATKLMTIAELLSGNMDVAEEIVVEGDAFAPDRPSDPIEFVDFKDWES